MSRARALSASLAVAGFVSLIAVTHRVDAFGCRPSLLPNGAAFDCATCHENPFGGGPRNPFGELVDDVAVGCDDFWGPAIAMVDSDGDGLTNGEELLDPEGLWAPGDPDPGNPDDVTHPGVADVVGETAFIRGDVDTDGQYNLSDQVRALVYLFSGGPALPCREAADANGDGRFDVSDPIYSLHFLFHGGSPPPLPFPDCGFAEDDVDCESYPPCE